MTLYCAQIVTEDTAGKRELSPRTTPKGWMHRDITAPNILLSPENKQDKTRNPGSLWMLALNYIVG